MLGHLQSDWAHYKDAAGGQPQRPATFGGAAPEEAGAAAGARPRATSAPLGGGAEGGERGPSGRAPGAGREDSFERDCTDDKEAEEASPSKVEMAEIVKELDFGGGGEEGRREAPGPPAAGPGASSGTAPAPRHRRRRLVAVESPPGAAFVAAADGGGGGGAGAGASAAAGGASSAAAGSPDEFHDASEGAREWEEDEGSGDWPLDDDDRDGEAGGGGGDADEEDMRGGTEEDGGEETDYEEDEEEEEEEEEEDDDDTDYVPTPMAPRRGRSARTAPAARAAAPAAATVAAAPQDGANRRTRSRGSSRGGASRGGSAGGRRKAGEGKEAGSAGGDGEGDGGASAGASSSDAAGGASDSEAVTSGRSSGTNEGGGGKGVQPGCRSAANARAKLTRVQSQRRRVLFQAWTNPVLQHLNETRIKQGRAPVEKITNKALKDALEGAVMPGGQQFKPGAMTRDQLIEEYRRLLQLPADVVEGISTDIDRVTGVAQWRAVGAAADMGDQDLLAAAASAIAGTSCGGGSWPGATPGVPGGGAAPQPLPWVPAAAPRGRPGSGGGAQVGGPGVRPGGSGEFAGSPRGSPMGRNKRRDDSPLEARQTALKLPRQVDSGLWGSLPNSPRHRHLADSPRRPGSGDGGGSGGGAAPARRTRDGGGGGGKSRRPLSGSSSGGGGGRGGRGGGSGLHLSSSFDASLLVGGFRRVLEAEQATPAAMAVGPQRLPQPPSALAGGGGRLQHPGVTPLVLPGSFLDGPMSSKTSDQLRHESEAPLDGCYGRGGLMTARQQQGKSIWR